MSNFNYTEMSRVVEVPNTFLAVCAAGSKSTPMCLRQNLRLQAALQCINV